ncbi:19613_t:CDS:2 [Gigaspora margarita]|uniref:19613_t:CDS:1 n=1 Tax=Gigaspora margarita TaxID=4874 RepID=A0ABN7VH85_GIGMA|nr:19613_t:CDS:2 [Gigaspora margarita]
MADTQYTIVSLRELNTKLTVEISELRKKYAKLEAKNIKVEAENAKLKQDKEEVEARFLNLEQKDREKTDLIAKLKHDVSLIKEQSLQNRSNRYTDNASDNAEYRTSNSDIYQVKDNRSSIPPKTNHNREDTPAFDITDDTSNSNVCQETKTQLGAGSCQCSTSPICIENKSSEDKVIDEFLDLKEKEKVSNIIREKNSEKKLGSQDLSYDKDISQSSKNKVQKFMAEVSKNSSSSISNSNADNDVIPTTLNETESQPSNNSFTFLYEKLCNAIILADHNTQKAILCYCNFGKALIQRHNELASEKQVDPGSNAVSRILNKEVHAQLPIEPTLKSKNPELSSGSDDENHMSKLSSSEDISNTEVSASLEKKEYQVLSENTSNSENRKNSKNNTLNLFPLKNMLSKEKQKEFINKLTMHFTDSPKVDLYCSVDKEGEHQTDTYWVFGLHCPLCRENHMSLKGIPFDEVLEAYPENSKLIQELKTQSFTLPIPWDNVLKFPNKSITVGA